MRAEPGRENLVTVWVSKISNTSRSWEPRSHRVASWGGECGMLIAVISIWERCKWLEDTWDSHEIISGFSFKQTPHRQLELIDKVKVAWVKQNVSMHPAFGHKFISVPLFGLKHSLLHLGHNFVALFCFSVLFDLIVIQFFISKCSLHT